MKVKIIEPLKENNLQFINEDDIDLHVRLDRDIKTGAIFTIGAKINNEWIPLYLRGTNRWWDKLAKPKTYYEKPITKEYSKASDDYWTKLSQPLDRKITNKYNNKLIKLKINKFRYKDEDCENKWWDRLSQPKWKQAEIMRQQIRNNIKSTSINNNTKLKEQEEPLALLVSEDDQGQSLVSERQSLEQSLEQYDISEAKFRRTLEMIEQVKNLSVSSDDDSTIAGDNDDEISLEMDNDTVEISPEVGSEISPEIDNENELQLDELMETERKSKVSIQNLEDENEEIVENNLEDENNAMVIDPIDDNDDAVAIVEEEDVMSADSAVEEHFDDSGLGENSEDSGLGENLDESINNENQ